MRRDGEMVIKRDIYDSPSWFHGGVAAVPDMSGVSDGGEGDRPYVLVEYERGL